MNWPAIISVLPIGDTNQCYENENENENDANHFNETSFPISLFRLRVKMAKEVAPTTEDDKVEPESPFQVLTECLVAFQDETHYTLEYTSFVCLLDQRMHPQVLFVTEKLYKLAWFTC